MGPLDFLRLLLDPDRLAVVGLLARRPATAAELAAETGQRERDVLETLAPLVQAGLAERDGDRYRLVVGALRAMARDLPQPPPAAREIAYGMTPDEAAVLGRFFQGDQLVEIPVTRAKRQVVLERLALEFEPGRRYTEADVTKILTRFHEDYATLRRYLINADLLDRDAGEYWRAGGRVN